MSSKVCSAITSNGVQCCGSSMKSKDVCWKHIPNNSNIIHSLPVLPIVNPSDITFSSENVQSSCCQWKNKYGEYVCKNEGNNYKFCEFHFEKFNYFYGIFKRLLQICNSYIQEGVTFDSFMKEFLNLVKFVIKYKELLVNCSMDTSTKIFIAKYYDTLETITYGKIHRNLKFNKKSTPIRVYIVEMLKFKYDIMTLQVELQIKKSRSELVSNTIKIQKLSEIYVKSNSKDICPVICRGIEKNILSFIV